MFKDFALTFSEGVSTFVREEYKKASNIIEYGSGGSTILAASEGKTVISTESSASWLLEVMGAYKERNLQGDIIPIHCDIGETKEWGHPVSDSSWRSWPSYSTKAWQYCDENNIQPDLVLVDGRFRVACFVASCVNTTTPLRILFDDYVERPQYHVVEKLIKPTSIIDGRLAVFDVEPDSIGSKFLMQNVSCFYNPA